MTDAPRTRIPTAYLVTMLVAAGLGLLAAFQLTVDEFTVLKNPKAELTCTINPFVECTTNLLSPQGRVFGFPNPLLGVVGWAVVLAIVMGAVAGARYARWFWVATNVGLTAAMVFCIWLMTQTFLVLGRLCTWCLLTWSVTILALVATTALNLSRGVFGSGARPAGRFLLRWSPLVVLLAYLVIALLIQLKFDLIGYYLR
ncbi:MAG: vitamin K epoxide reductase family protein [Micrococcales bacterium]|nr:vitamin K epoxide reductase family protein [Micrococcales bacterium]